MGPEAEGDDDESPPVLEGQNIAMEFADGGSLANYLENNQDLSGDDTLNILKDIASGVQQAHANDICHNDIKVFTSF